MSLRDYGLSLSYTDGSDRIKIKKEAWVKKMDANNVTVVNKSQGPFGGPSFFFAQNFFQATELDIGQ